jgi:peptidoglycan/LPS O-acetylase OafA/YrhL
MKRFEHLTALRAIFAWWVVLYHIREWFPFDYGFRVLYPLAFGYLGVDFFFVLSGFVIHYSYKEKLLSGNESASRFIWLRIARIYPLHLCILLLYLLNPIAITFLSSKGTIPDTYSIGYFFASLLMVQNWGFSDGLKWNGPAWSISTEFLAYLTYPLWLFVFKIKLMKPFMAIFTSLLLALGLAFLFNKLSLPSIGSSIELVGPLRCVVEFIMGTLVAELVIQRKTPTKWNEKLLITTVAFAGMGFNGWIFGLFDYAFIPLFVFLVIFLVATSQYLADHPPIRALVFMGEISYATYICHFLFKEWFVFLNLPVLLRPILLVPLYITVVFIASWMLYKFIEIPAQKFLRNLFVSKQAMST